MENNKKKQMHQTVCTDCGKGCEVPFVPAEGRPVYCNECFGRHGGAKPSRMEEDGGRGRGGKNKEMHDALCAKCGKSCQVPFTPRPDKAVFCDDCFGQKNKNNRSNDELLEQIKMLNSKMDKLMTVLISVDTEAKPKKAQEKKEKAVKNDKKAKGKNKSSAKKNTAKKKK